MASCGYHSPQFSEDIAWLPAWLQPHQLPAFGDGATDEHTISQFSCKNLALLPKNMSDGQDIELFTEGDAKYSGFHLYLSGDGKSPAGTIQSSAEALHFHLRLSSLGTSQLSTSPLTEMPQPGNRKTNDGSPKKHFREIPAIHDGTTCQHKTEDEAPAFESPTGNKSRMSHKQISRPLIKADLKCQQKLKGKSDAGNICNADVNDAVELSIAASEAMVISDMVTSSLHSENLPAAAILEITLRVKHARNECSLDILETVSSFQADELGESDLLSDLDENIMADAFDDVGVSLTQIVKSLDNSHYSEKSPRSNCHLKTHISENHFGIKEEANKKLKAHDTIANDASFQTCAVVAMGSVPKYLPLQPLPLQQTKSSAFVPLDRTKSCLKSQSKVDTKKMQQNDVALIPIRMGSQEDRRIHKDESLSRLGDEIMRKSITVFNRETSFISESMDDMDERTGEHITEAEPEIVASSSTPSRDLSRCPYKESERSILEGRGLSQDLVRSSSLSLVDPLCSMVPCSIPSEDAPISSDPHQELTKEDSEKFMGPKRAISSKELNEKIMLSDVQEAPLKPLAEGSPALSKNNVEVPIVPNRKHFNSLRHYSLVMPNPNNYKPIPSQSIARQVLQFSPVERNNTCFMGNKPDAEISLKTIGSCRDVDGSRDNHGPGSQDQEKIRGPSATGEAKDDDIGSLIHHHEDIGRPIILNNKKRRLRACKILNSDGEEEGLEETSPSNIRKCKIVFSTNEVKCSELANFQSRIPVQSGLRSHPSDKEILQNKRVRFSEAISSMDRTKSSSRLQSKHRTHGSHHRFSKRVKESSLSNKSTSKKEKYNYLTCQHIVGEKGMIFQGLEFLLTGFSRQKEKELEALIKHYGGYVLINIPSNPPDLRGKQRAGLARLKLPIVLSPKKVQTTKFLYGCATNTWMLNAHWLVDSIHAGSLLLPGKYMMRLIQGSEFTQLRVGDPFCLNSHTFIFERVGIMLNGKVSFCTKFSKIIKHGGGQVFKSLQRLVHSLKNGMNTMGAVLVENEGNVSRHLKHCALENNLQTVPASWIVNSLFSGKLLPLKKDHCAPLHRIKMPTFYLAQDDDMSEEI